MSHDADDDLHDRGLAFDLQTMVRRAQLPQRLERRGALKVLAGAAGGLVLVACGSDASGSNGTTSTTGASTSTTAAGGTTSTTASGTSGDPIPEETAGPYPADGSNGPNVLTESGVVRQDLRSSFGRYSGTAEGATLRVQLLVVDAGSGQPLDGAAVYLWHCDPEGRYSLYSQGATDQNWLRGVQAAGSDGTLSFTTVFPGAYSGRYPHLHFEVYPSVDSATSAASRLVTSQLALPEDACTAVYATSGYEASASNFPRSPLAQDMVFRDGIESQLAAVSGDVGSMTATLTIRV